MRLGLSLGLLGALSLTHPRQPAASVAGTVFDSLAREPLKGARVQLVSAVSSASARPLSTTSDSAGRFHFDGISPGRYVIGFYHESLDTLGIEGEDRVIDVGSSDLAVPLGTPSARTMIDAMCGADSAHDGATLLLGHIHDGETDAPLPAASAVVDWSQATLSAASIDVHDRAASAKAHADGFFALCGLPSETPLELRAVRGADSTAAIPIRFAAYGVMHVSLFVPAVDKRDARLVGHVHDQSGKPLAHAQVRSRGGPRASVTGDDGSFGLDSLPSGTQAIEMKAVGYAPLTHVVHLRAGEAATLDLVAEPVTSLAPVLTVAQKTAQYAALFESHKRLAPGGLFIKPTRLAGYESGQRVHTLLQGLTGVKVTNSFGRWTVSMLRPNVYMDPMVPMVACTPSLFLNGVKSLLDVDDVDVMVEPNDILGVEVYNTDTQVPRLYALPAGNACGLISVWTRATAAAPGGR